MRLAGEGEPDPEKGLLYIEKTNKQKTPRTPLSLLSPFTASSHSTPITPHTLADNLLSLKTLTNFTISEGWLPGQHNLFYLCSQSTMNSPSLQKSNSSYCLSWSINRFFFTLRLGTLQRHYSLNWFRLFIRLFISQLLIVYCVVGSENSQRSNSRSLFSRWSRPSGKHMIKRHLQYNEMGWVYHSHQH